MGKNPRKTADLGTISVQIFYIYMYYVYGWWLLSGRGGVPPLNEILIYLYYQECMNRP